MDDGIEYDHLRHYPLHIDRDHSTGNCRRLRARRVASAWHFAAAGDSDSNDEVT